MADVSSEIVQKLKDALRIKNDSAEEEIRGLVPACLHDLNLAGAYADDLDDALTYQAVKLYCKWQFGYDSDVDRFRSAYTNLRDSMALSGDYPAKDG